WSGAPAGSTAKTMHGAVGMPAPAVWHETTHRWEGSCAALASSLSRAAWGADGASFAAVSGPTPRPASSTATTTAAATRPISERIARLRLNGVSATSGHAAQQLGDA